MYICINKKAKTMKTQNAPVGFANFMIKMKTIPFIDIDGNEALVSFKTIEEAVKCFDYSKNIPFYDQPLIVECNQSKRPLHTLTFGERKHFEHGLRSYYRRCCLNPDSLEAYEKKVAEYILSSFSEKTKKYAGLDVKSVIEMISSKTNSHGEIVMIFPEHFTCSVQDCFENDAFFEDAANEFLPGVHLLVHSQCAAM